MEPLTYRYIRSDTSTRGYTLAHRTGSGANHSFVIHDVSVGEAATGFPVSPTLVRLRELSVTHTDKY